MTPDYSLEHEKAYGLFYKGLLIKFMEDIPTVIQVIEDHLQLSSELNIDVPCAREIKNHLVDSRKNRSSSQSEEMQRSSSQSEEMPRYIEVYQALLELLRSDPKVVRDVIERSIISSKEYDASLSMKLFNLRNILKCEHAMYTDLVQKRKELTMDILGHAHANEKLGSTMVKVELEKHDLENKLKELQKELEDSQKELKDLQNTNERTRRLKEKEKEIQKSILPKYNAALAKTSNANEDLERVEAALDKKRGELDKKRGELARLDGDLVRLDVDIEKSKIKLEGKKRDFDEKMRDFDEKTREKMRELDSARQRFDQELMEIRRESDEILSKTEKEKIALQGLQDEFSRLEKDLAVERDLIEKVNFELIEKVNFERDLAEKVKIADMESQNQSLKCDLDAEIEKKWKLEKYIERVKEQNGDLLADLKRTKSVNRAVLELCKSQTCLQIAHGNLVAAIGLECEA